jgi:hypothetical protein
MSMKMLCIKTFLYYLYVLTFDKKEGNKSTCDMCHLNIIVHIDYLGEIHYNELLGSYSGRFFGLIKSYCIQLKCF